MCGFVCVQQGGRSSRDLFAMHFLFLGGVGYACLTGGKIGLNLPDEIQSRLCQNLFCFSDCFSCVPRENINYGYVVLCTVTRAVTSTADTEIKR